MSTKIYYGYRLRAGTDVWEFTERLRAEGNERRDRLDMKAVELLAERAEAKRLEEGKEQAQTREAYLMGGYLAWQDVMNQLGESRLSDPHQLDVTFIRDPKTDRILALLYAGSEMQDIFIDQPEVEYFGYWNNTDPDENCTEGEWAEREETWERCLGMDAPVRRGLSFTLRPNATDGIIEMIYRDRANA